MVDDGQLPHNERGGRLAGSDDLVHPGDQEAGVAEMAPLAGGIEDERKAASRAASATSPSSISTLRRACQMRTFDGVGGLKRRRSRSRTDQAARSPSGAIGSEPRRRRHCVAISGAIVRLTAVPPE